MVTASYYLYFIQFLNQHRCFYTGQ